MSNEDNPVNIGVDVGKQHDPSAIVVSEAIQRVMLDRSTGQQKVKHVAFSIVDGEYFEGYDIPLLETVYISRYMKRLALGLPYPEQAEEIARIATSGTFAKRTVRVLIDVTGVGRPVFDMIYQIIYQNDEALANVLVKPITFTHGDRYNEETGLLGKAYLVSRLQALGQTGCAQLPPGNPLAEPTRKEMMDYEIRIDEDGNDRYGAFKTGAHDDIVTAWGLSVIEDPWLETASVGVRMY